jgi:hypothetical protein
MHHRSRPTVLLLLIAALVLVPAPARGALWLDITRSWTPGEVVSGSTARGALPMAIGSSLSLLLLPRALEPPEDAADPAYIGLGELAVDAHGTGTATFMVPDVPIGLYSVVVRCPACAPMSAGRSMLPIAVVEVSALPVTVTPAPLAPGTTPGPDVTIADLATCPVTIPTLAPAEIQGRLWGSGAAAGDEHLWVGGLGEDGVMRMDARSVEADGSMGTKLGWWRFTPGRLTIDGRRLDGAAPGLGWSLSPYGSTAFQASAVLFPTEGCWEVTGHAGGHSLTFVTLVIRVEG